MPSSTSFLAFWILSMLRRCMPICTTRSVARTALIISLALLERMRQRLLLVHVLLGIERGVEHRRVLVVRRRDQDRVDGFFRQQFLIVDVRFGVGMLGLGLVGVRAVHLGEGCALGAVFLEHTADVLPASPGARTARIECDRWLPRRTGERTAGPLRPLSSGSLFVPWKLFLIRTAGLHLPGRRFYFRAVRTREG